MDLPTSPITASEIAVAAVQAKRAIACRVLVATATATARTAMGVAIRRRGPGPGEPEPVAAAAAAQLDDVAALKVDLLLLAEVVAAREL